MRFAELNDELASLRRETVANQTSGKSPAVQSESILKRVQAERDSALADLRRMSCERDSLLEQVKINRENRICETVDLEQKCEDLERRARLLENERRDLLLSKLG